MFGRHRVYLKGFQPTSVRKKVILRVVLVCVGNGVGVGAQDKLYVVKSLRRPWSGGKANINIYGPETCWKTSQDNATLRERTRCG